MSSKTTKTITQIKVWDDRCQKYWAYEEIMLMSFAKEDFMSHYYCEICGVRLVKIEFTYSNEIHDNFDKRQKHYENYHRMGGGCDKYGIFCKYLKNVELVLGDGKTYQDGKLK